MRKLTLLLVLAGLVAFFFVGCTPTTPMPQPVKEIVRVEQAARLQGSGERVERIVISPIFVDPRNNALYVKWNPNIGPDQEYRKPGATEEAIVEDIAPIKSQNTFVVTAVRWEVGARNMQNQMEKHPDNPTIGDGYWVMVPGIKIKWILNSFEDMGIQRRVGDIVDWDHSYKNAGSMDGWQDYLYNTVTTLTNYEPEKIKVQIPQHPKDWKSRASDGKAVPTMDKQYREFEIQKGQTYVTITATRAGQTDLTAYAPEILYHLGLPDGPKYDKVFITKQWGKEDEFGLEIILVDEPCDPFDINFLIAGGTFANAVCRMCDWRPNTTDEERPAIRYTLSVYNTSNQDIHDLWMKFVVPRWEKDRSPDKKWLVANPNKQWTVLGWRYLEIDGQPITNGICVPIQWTPQGKQEGVHADHPINLILPRVQQTSQWSNYDPSTLRKGRRTVLEIYVQPRNVEKRDNTAMVWASFREWEEGTVGETNYTVVEKENSICIEKSALAKSVGGKPFATEEPTKVSIINVMFSKRVEVGSPKVCKKDSWGKCTITADKRFRVDANVNDTVTYIYEVTNTGGTELKNVWVIENWETNNIGVGDQDIKVGNLKPGETKTVKSKPIVPNREGEAFGRAFIRADGLRTVGICEVPQHLVAGSPAAEDVLTDVFHGLNPATGNVSHFYFHERNENYFPNDLVNWFARNVNFDVRQEVNPDPISMAWLKKHNNKIAYMYTFRNQQTGYLFHMNWVFMTDLPKDGNNPLQNLKAYHLRPAPNGVAGDYIVLREVTDKFKVEFTPTKQMYYNHPNVKTFPSNADPINIHENRIANQKKNVAFLDLPDEYSIGAGEVIVMFFVVPVDMNRFQEGKYQSFMAVNAASECVVNASGKFDQKIDSVAGEPTHLVKE